LSYPRPTVEDVTNPEGEVVVIDCEGCTAKGPACGDCVVTVLLGAPPDGVKLDDTERRALAVLAEGGLVPPLRLVTGAERPRGRPHVA